MDSKDYKPDTGRYISESNDCVDVKKTRNGVH